MGDAIYMVRIKSKQVSVFIDLYSSFNHLFYLDTQKIADQSVCSERSGEIHLSLFEACRRRFAEVRDEMLAQVPHSRLAQLIS